MVCYRIPAVKKLLFVRTAGFDQAIEVLVAAKEIFKSSLNALEYIDHETFLLAQRHSTFIPPFAHASQTELKEGGARPCYLIVEAFGEEEAYLSGIIEAFYIRAAGSIQEMLLAESKANMQDIWEFREHLVMYLKDAGRVLKYDLSIPPVRFEELCEQVRRKFKGQIKHCTSYGHIADGNIHLQVILDSKQVFGSENKKAFDDFIYGLAANMNGSISAEHGIGQLKRAYLGLAKSPESLKYMAGLKRLFDPQGILNPHKTFPATF